MSSRGVVYVHSALPAICPHVEWALAGVLGTRVSLSWTAQPAAPGQLRAEAAWEGQRGTGAKLAAALRSWAMLRFEVTEDPSLGQDGERICHLPGRGLWRAKTAANGDLMIGEDQIRSLMAQHPGAEALRHALAQALGTDIDAELEAFRSAGEGSAITWLHQVG